MPSSVIIALQITLLYALGLVCRLLVGRWTMASENGEMIGRISSQGVFK
jgi:hypothetical protein